MTGVSQHRVVVAVLFIISVIAAQVSWLLATPAFYGIDEIDHIYRAASVAEGHWQPGRDTTENGRGQLILVPADIVVAAHDACEGLGYVGPDNCTRTSEPNSHSEVRVASAAATYNPVWYAAAGQPSRWLDGASAVLGVRIVSLIICDLLLLTSALLLLRRFEGPWPLIGLVTTCSPVLVYATVTGAPNGMAYAAGILLWAGIVGVVADQTNLVGPLFAVVVGAILVMAGHSTGLMWIAVIFLCCLPILIAPIGDLWRAHRAALLTSGFLVAIAAAGCAAWIVTAGTNDPRSEPSGGGPMPATWLIKGPALWFFQSQATLRFRDEPAPILVYALGTALLASIVITAYRRAQRRLQATLVLTVVCACAVPLALMIYSYPYLGAAWQGRYGLPLTAGIVLMATTLTRPPQFDMRIVKPVVLVAVIVMHIMTVVAMYRLNTGHQSTIALAALLGLGLVQAMSIAGALQFAPRDHASQHAPPRPVAAQS